MNRKAIFAVLTIVAVITLLVLAGLWLAGPSKSKGLRLADGSILSVRKVTYNSPHEIAYALGWRDRLIRCLPLDVAKRLGGTTAAVKFSQTNSIVVWLQRDFIPYPRTPGAVPFGSPPSVEATVFDANGVESARASGSFWTYTSVCAVELNDFPRRSREFTLRLESRSATTLLKIGDLKVRNPAPCTVPGWVPENLPATRETNGLTVSLLAIQTGRHSWADDAPVRDELGKYSRATFSIQQNGQTATNWAISRLHFDSAASGPKEPTTYGSSWYRDRFTANFECALWPEEPAWKVTAEAWRLGDFPAGELWTVKGIAVPNQGKVTEVNTKTNIYGTEVELLGVARSGAAMSTQWIQMNFGAAAVLQATLGIHPADVHLSFVEARDDLGRNVETQGTGYSGDSTNKMHYVFGLKIPDDAKTIDVTLAVSKSRNVEFMVKPGFTKMIKANPGSK